MVEEERKVLEVNVVSMVLQDQTVLLVNPVSVDKKVTLVMTEVPVLKVNEVFPANLVHKVQQALKVLQVNQVKMENPDIQVDEVKLDTLVKPAQPVLLA